jgi:phosphoglycolate phosphatase-like HAD superfamily hydrolase
MPITCVLFDFDGPVCHLFKWHRAKEVASRLLAGLPDEDRERIKAEGARVASDPQRILDILDRDLLGEFEERLTAEEVLAADSAESTPGAAVLIRALSEAGVALAVTTNNSKEAAERYLARRDVGLLGLFGPKGANIHGREKKDRRLRKPDPYCLECALKSTGAKREETVMIGDTLADFEAARTLDIRFIGYADRPEKKKSLSDAGAHVIGMLPTSLAKLAEEVRQL